MDEAMTKAIQTVIAAKIVEALDGPQRDAILAKAVTDSLAGYSFNRVLETMIEERAGRAAREMLESGRYDVEIGRAVASGLGGLIGELPDALRSAFLHSLHNPPNTSGYGASQSILAKYLTWPKEPK